MILSDLVKKELIQSGAEEKRRKNEFISKDTKITQVRFKGYFTENHHEGSQRVLTPLWATEWMNGLSALLSQLKSQNDLTQKKSARTTRCLFEGFWSYFGYSSTCMTGPPHCRGEEGERIPRTSSYIAMNQNNLRKQATPRSICRTSNMFGNCVDMSCDKTRVVNSRRKTISWGTITAHARHGARPSDNISRTPRATSWIDSH